MPPKTSAKAQPISMVYLDSIFSFIYGLTGKEEYLEKIKPKFENQEIVFQDRHLENPTSFSEAPPLTDDWKYASLSEVVAYVGTLYGKNKTIRNQVVGCELVEIDSKKYYVAVGRHNGKLALYFMPESKKCQWPVSSIFLRFKSTPTVQE